MSDITSMSWSLAEGITRRDIRTLRKNALRVSDLYIAMSLHGSRATGKKRLKFFESLLADFQGMWLSEGTGSKRRRYNYVLWELNDKDGFDRIDIKVKRDSIDIQVVAFGVSFHALARIIYRRNLSSITDAMVELNSNLEMQGLVVSQVMNSDDQKNYRTQNGFFIMKTFEDGCVRAVTWIDEAKGSKGQLEVNSNLYTTICGLAESRKQSVHDYIKYCIEYTKLGTHKQFRNSYIKAGGDVEDLDAMATFYERRIIEITNNVSEEELEHA